MTTASAMQALHYETVDSTNEEAKRLVRAGTIRSPAFLIAREQTAGRGSRGRRWISPKDAGLYLTVVDWPDHPCGPDTTAYTLAAGIACAEALRAGAGLGVHLKPINDIYMHGRKLGGILVEAFIEHGRVQTLLTGVGLNLARAERPVTPDGPAPTSLEEHMDHNAFRALDRESLVATIVAGIRTWNARVAREGAAAVRKRWSYHQLPGTTCPMP